MQNREPQPEIHHRDMGDADLVRHHYNRRSIWGADTILYRKAHPMSWKRMEGNYQNWLVDVSAVEPPDAEMPNAEPVKLFYNDDVSIYVSRRRESMPYFYRNCDADELHLVSKGSFKYETDFGVIEAREREFLLIPKGITYRATLEEPQDTLRIIYESPREITLTPHELIDHYYGNKGRSPVDAERVEVPKLQPVAHAPGEFLVKAKYSGAFAEFIGETSSIVYDYNPLDVESIDGAAQVFKFSFDDIERFQGTPPPFIIASHLENRQTLTFTLNISGSGRLTTPVHRDPDVDELRYIASGDSAGKFSFTPQGVDHGAGRGYTKKERNLPMESDRIGDVVTIYTFKALKGTSFAYALAKPFMA